MINNYDSVDTRFSSGSSTSTKQEDTSYTGKKRTWISLITLFVALFSFVSVQAQVTTNGGSGLATTYTSLANAITALNAATINGPVVITLTGNETAPVGGYNITASGTSVNTIIIQGSTSVITAPAQTSGSLVDAIFKISGGDWITIQNFTMNERAFTPVAADTTAGTNTMTEFGVALFYATTTNGAQNCTIQNNTITLNRTYTNTFGIYSNSTHSATAATTSATATSTAGGNSGLKVYGNTISNVNQGIVVVGPTAAADLISGVDIGGSSITTGNTISNFGTAVQASSYANVSGTINGILIRNVIGFNVSYNTITSSNGGVNAASTTLRGIFITSASNAPTGTFINNINNNTVALTHGFTSGTIQGVTVEATTGTATSTQNINNNNFTAFGTSAASTSGAITAISCVMPNLITNINNNTFTNITSNTTGSFTFISNSFTRPANGTATVNNNSIVTAFNKTGAGGTVTFYNSNSTSPVTATETNTGNNFSNIAVTGATTIAGWVSTDGSTTSPFGSNKVVTNNTFNNIAGGTSPVTLLNVAYSNNGNTGNNVSGNTISNISAASSITALTSAGGAQNFFGNTIFGLNSSGASAVTGINIGGGAATNVYQNKIYNLLGTNAGSTVNGIAIGGGTTINTYNNIIGDLRATAASGTDVIRGISITSTTATSTQKVYYNTIYLNGTSSGANFGSSGIFHTYSATATTAALDLRNNIIVNASTANGTGLAVAFRRSAATDLNNYASSSNNNLFYGTSGLFNNGTNYATLSAFQTLVSTRETASKFQNPTFASTTGSDATYLHFLPGATNLAGSYGQVISGFITDFDNDSRDTTSPDIGADEWSNGVIVAPTVTSFAPTVLCLNGGQSITFTGTGFDTVTSILFNGPTGVNLPGVVTASTSTTLTVTIPVGVVDGGVIITNPAGSVDTTGTANVFTTVAPPTISATAATSTICAGASTTLTGTGGVTYSWFPGTGLSATTGTTVTASPTVTTTYTVTGVSAEGCSSTGTVTVTVLPAASAITITKNPASICQGGITTLTATGGTVDSRASLYSFAGSTGTYTPITGTAVSSAIGDDYGIGNLPIGFTFPYNGSTQTVFGVSSNGMILLGNTSAAWTTGFSSNALATTANIISPLWDDNNTTGGSVLYSTTGTAPNRVLTVQWTGMHVAGTGSSTNPTIDMQALLYENGTIQFIYGAQSATLSSPTASIGISGAIGNYLSVSPLSPITTSTVSSTTENTAVVTANIPSGTILTFTRPLQPVMLWTPATNLFTDAAATVPYAGESTAVVYTKLTTPETYTLTSTLGTCPVSNTVTVTPNLLPTITLGTAAPVCLGGLSSSLSFTATTDAPNQYTIDFDAAANTAGFADITTFTAFTTSPIALTVPASAVAGTYNGTILVKNSTTGCVSATPQAFSITINTPVAITTQPSNSVSLENSNASFTVAATGSGLTYQWQESTDNGVTWTNISGATSATYTAVSVTNGMNGNQYKCIVSGAAPCTSVTSNVVSLTISTTAITTQPTSTTICSNGSATFTIATSGSTPTYQWQLSTNNGTSWTDISGETNTSLTVSGLTAANSLQQYRCVLSPGPIYSNAAILTINDVVAITTQPADATVCSNATNATFTAVATGTGLTYQWQQRANSSGTWANVGTGTTGGTTATLTVTPIALALDGYQYQCIITGTAPCVALTSATATLSVTGFTVATSAASICIGSTFTLTATPTTSSPTLSYSWLCATVGSGATTAVTGNSATITPTQAGTYVYTVTATDGTCTLTTTQTIVVNPLPVITTATANPTVACAGSIINLAATINQILPGNSTSSGSGTSYTSSTSYPTFFGNYWYQDWNQMVYTASELQAMGLNAGNITSLTINIGALPSPTTINGYTIRLGSTTNSALTTFQTTGLTTVYGPVNYTVSATGNITINFTTPYAWDGTSNIIVDVRGTGAYGSANATTQFTATTGNTVVYAYSSASNTSFWTSNPTATASTSRPNIRFGGQILTNTTSNFTWSWSDGTSTVLTSASGTVTLPNATTTYTVTATNPTTGCTSSQNVTVTSNPLPTAPTTTNSTQCGTQVPSASVVDPNAFTTPTFKWYAAATGGTALQSSTSTTYTTAIATTTTFYVSVINPTTGCESARTAVTVTVNTPDAITATSSNTTICLGQSVTLTAANSANTPVQNYAYSWLSTANSGVTTAQSGASITATPTAAGTYTYTASAVDGSCQTTNTVTVTVYPLPVITTATATPNVACAGSTINLDATIVENVNGTINLGTGVATSTSSGANPFYGGYGGVKTQYLLTASELTALGLAAGNITSIGIDVTSAGSTLNGFGVNIDTTSLTALTANIENVTNNVYSGTFTPTVGINTITFSSPFNWDGTSNIILSFCWSNANTSNTASTIKVNTTSFVSANARYVDSQSAINVCAYTGNTLPSGWNGAATSLSTRPNFIISGVKATNVTSSYNWTWKIGTTSVLSTAAGTTVVPTGASTTYTVTATNPTTGCSASQNVTVSTNVAPLAMFAIAPQASSICVGETVTMYANPTGGCIPYTYSWSDGTSVVGTASTLAVTPTSDKTYTLTITDNAGTQLVKTATVTVNNPQPLSVVGQTICANSAAFTLSATESTAGNAIKWYAAQTGGTALATGNTFTTPSISASTTYYVQENALDPELSGNGLDTSTVPNSTGASAERGLVFTATKAFTLVSAQYYSPTTSVTNTVTVRLVDHATGTQIATRTLPIAQGTTADWYTMNLGFDILPGTYRLLASYSQSVNRSTTGFTYPYALGASGTITSGYDSGVSATTYSYFHNITIQEFCSGVRVPVTATLTNPTAITLSGASATICNGQTTATAVTVATGGSNYDVYAWSPSTGVIGNSSTGWTFNPTSTTTYTLTASQSAGTCSTTATYVVNVNPIPTALTITPSSLGQCINQSQSLSVTGGAIGVTGKVGAGTSTNTTSTPFKGFYGGSKTQALYTAAELTALGMAAGQKINTIGWVALSGTPLALNNFTVNIGFVSNTTLGSNFISGANTVVVAPASYTPTTGTGNIDFTVSPGLTWDGTSSLLVETCFNNNNGGGSSANSISVESSTVASGLNLYRSQDSTVDVCTNTTAPTTTTTRPNLRISTLETATTTWTPVTNLFLDSAATIPYTLGGNATTVYVKSATPVSTTYTVTSTSTAGCTNSTTVSVDIVALPTVVTVNPAAVCSPNTVDLTASAVTNGSSAGLTLTYWTNANATIALANPNAVTTSGTYYIKGTNVNGCSTVSPVTVTVNPLPVVTTVAPATVCYPNTVDLTAAAVTTGSASGLTFTYFTDSAATTALSNPNAVTTSGTYYIKGTNANGCSSIASVVVTINVTNVPTGSATQTFCGSGNLSQLVATGSNIRWYNAATGGTEYPASLWSLVGLVNGSTYYATQTVNGCESATRLAVTVVVNSIPTAPNAAAQSFCSAPLVSNLVPSGTAYTWYDAATAGNVLSTTTPLAAGTYYVSQTINGCESPRTSVTITISPIAAPTGAAIQTIFGGVAADATIEDISVSGAGVVWYPTAADAAAGTNAIAAGTQLVDGTTYYAVSVVGSCRSNALAVTVTVTLDNRTFDLENLKFYPNPVVDQLTIVYTKEITSIQIYNLNGQLVKVVQPNATNVQVDMTELSTAMYIVKVYAEDKSAELKVYKK
ncbi:T9SS type A sorting domain-containing protein [Flavobacterium sp. 20NA77.7]|uniref:T9SS type A sorting domain-containing protein n=1 Tax=Flavobacterium nakdongensis TaxID=3073563 RepID=A0ABY9RAR3_9FLAO|nr:T9SS type A sorting domain-containing protein [Flavobacterium sp. 20NA77.7]WMW78337.1 T9SS type A sorting domain-containing protein [Flavobacterium sp. 20NA77.7]